VNLGKTDFNIVPISTKYTYYTYKVFNLAISYQLFKQRIQQQLFSKDNEEETIELQDNRFQLYQDIYNSSHLDIPPDLKDKFKDTIEKLFGKNFAAAGVAVIKDDEEDEEEEI
jgi:hypothetical protein